MSEEMTDVNAQTPTQEPTQTTQTAPAPAGDAPSDGQTSRQMRESGVDLNTVDWMDKYNGLAGHLKQVKAQVQERDGIIATLRAENEAMKARLAEAATASEGMPALQEKLATTAAELETLRIRTERQRLLLEFPDLVKNTGEGENPIVNLIMHSTLTQDELKAEVEKMASILGQTSTLPLDGVTPAPGSPASDPTDAASLKKMALEWHNKFVESGRIDTEALAKSQEYWGKVREANSN